MYGLLEDVRLLSYYKFTGKQHKLVDAFLTKNAKVNSKKIAELFIKKITGSLSLKYLTLLIILNSYSDNRVLIEPAKSLAKRNFYFNKSSISNYLTLYKYWSNTTPFFYLDDTVVSSVIKIQAKSEEHDFSVYIRQYLGGFIENLVGRKIFLKIRTKINISNSARRILLDIYKIN